MDISPISVFFCLRHTGLKATAKPPTLQTFHSYTPLEPSVVPLKSIGGCLARARGSMPSCTHPSVHRKPYPGESYLSPLPRPREDVNLEPNSGSMYTPKSAHTKSFLRTFHTNCIVRPGNHRIASLQQVKYPWVSIRPVNRRALPTHLLTVLLLSLLVSGHHDEPRRHDVQ